MEFTSLDQIAFNQVTIELIADATALAFQVNNRRPLPTEVIEKILKDLLGERVYNSNAIEGNTLTLRETRRILDTGSIVDVGKKREATEVLNLGMAIEQLQSLVSDRKTWASLKNLTRIHRTLMTDVLEYGAGTIRSERVMITGAKRQPPRPEKLDDLLQSFSNQLAGSQDCEPLKLATWTHWALARLHPFMDGNGRMARLWQDLVLFGSRFTAAVIRHEDRTEYYNALSDADGGKFDPLAQLITRSLSRTPQIYVNAHREVDELKDWAASIVGETSARVDEKRQLEYLRWVRQMEQVKDAFERCATQITNASDGSVEVQVRPFDIIDQPTWETLRSGGSAGKTWFFWANFRQGGERIQYCFFFGGHWFSGAEREFSQTGPGTNLLISEQQGDGPSVRLSDVPNCPIALREILVIENKLTRKRIDTATDKEVYDNDVDALQTAREFMQQVFFSRLT